jgi:hypothetical protein
VVSPEHVEIIYLPPVADARSLKAGHIDGYCVGEPWNSESIIAWHRLGSGHLRRRLPRPSRKVLVVSGNFLPNKGCGRSRWSPHC